MCGPLSSNLPSAPTWPPSARISPDLSPSIQVSRASPKVGPMTAHSLRGYRMMSSARCQDAERVLPLPRPPRMSATRYSRPSSRRTPGIQPRSTCLDRACLHSGLCGPSSGCPQKCQPSCGSPLQSGRSQRHCVESATSTVWRSSAFCRRMARQRARCSGDSLERSVTVVAILLDCYSAKILNSPRASAAS
jgi:hypothetical protein